jgi:hypothetical protein
MKNAGLVLMLGLCSLPAQAEWVRYHRHVEADELYEATMLVREGERIRLWTLTDYVKPITTLEGVDVLSEKSLTTLDCAAKKMGSTQVIRYAGRRAQGAIISAMETPLRLVSVRAGSADAILFEKLCR